MREMSGQRASSLDRRRLAWRFGRLAEALCAWRLRLSGYRVVARDVRTPVGEIDLVARRGRVLAFIEVKARSAEAGPESPLMQRQRRRIVRAAEAFLAARPSLAALDVRFDLMLVGRGTLPRHLRAVFRADD
jgi:putative endonuclease